MKVEIVGGDAVERAIEKAGDELLGGYRSEHVIKQPDAAEKAQIARMLGQTKYAKKPEPTDNDVGALPGILPDIERAKLNGNVGGVQESEVERLLRQHGPKPKPKPEALPDD